MMGWRATICGIAAAFVVGGNGAMAFDLDGTWGVQNKARQVVCAGTAVMVLREGRYFKVLPAIGTSVGQRNLVIDHSIYSLEGDLLHIEPGRSLRQFTPAQAFLIDPIGGLHLRSIENTPLVYRRCDEDIIPDETW
jgi:hypothetical protein